MRSNSAPDWSYSSFSNFTCASAKRVRAVASPEVGTCGWSCGSKVVWCGHPAKQTSSAAGIHVKRIGLTIVYFCHMKKRDDAPAGMDALTAHLDRGWDLLKKNDLRGAEISARKAMEAETDA